MFKISFRILICSIALSSCNTQTMIDVYKENLVSKIEGEVKNIEIYKGGGVLLSVKTKKKVDAIGLGNKFFKIVKEGDYFIKYENSNECIIRRNDSIIYLDCYDIPKAIRDSLGLIKEWPQDKKGFWQRNETSGSWVE